MSIKQQFTDELVPLLMEADAAITAGNVPKMRAVTNAILLLVIDYSDKLTREELRDALNNPTANAIARRLGVLPQ
jgi:hypothetical protein